MLGFFGPKLQRSPSPPRWSPNYKRLPQGWPVRHRVTGNWVRVSRCCALRPPSRPARVPSPSHRHRRGEPARAALGTRAKRGRRHVEQLRGGDRLKPPLPRCSGGCTPQGQGVATLDALCRPRTSKGGPMPASTRSAQAKSPTSGGARRPAHRERVPQPPPHRAALPAASQDHCRGVSTLRAHVAAIAKLRGHGLVAKVPRSRLYRVTSMVNGSWPALAIHDDQYARKLPGGGITIPSVVSHANSGPYY